MLRKPSEVRTPEDNEVISRLHSTLESDSMKESLRILEVLCKSLPYNEQ